MQYSSVGGLQESWLNRTLGSGNDMEAGLRQKSTVEPQMKETTSDTCGPPNFSYLTFHHFYWPRIPSPTSCGCD